MRQEDIVFLLLPVIQNLQGSFYGRPRRSLELTRLNGCAGHLEVGLELDIDEASLFQFSHVFTGR